MALFTLICYNFTIHGAAFDAYDDSQDISPSASNERMMYFLTVVTLPIDGSHISQLRIGAAFDRSTGEAINNWDLFSCPAPEVKQKIMDIAGVDET